MAAEGDPWRLRPTVGEQRDWHELPETGEPRHFDLTPREHQILDLLVTGMPNKQIAHKLGVTSHSIKHHLTRLYKKLGVRGRVEAALAAFHHGLFDVPKPPQKASLADDLLADEEHLA